MPGKLLEQFTKSYVTGLREATGTAYGKLRKQFAVNYGNNLWERFIFEVLIR